MAIFSTVQIFLDTCERNQKKIILKIWSLTQATAFIGGICWVCSEIKILLCMYLYLNYVIFAFIYIINWISIRITRKCTNPVFWSKLLWLYRRPLKRFNMLCLYIRNSMAEKTFRYILTQFDQCTNECMPWATITF